LLASKISAVDDTFDEDEGDNDYDVEDLMTGSNVGEEEDIVLVPIKETNTKYNDIINATLADMGLSTIKIAWYSNRIEITAGKANVSSTDEDVCPNADQLEQAHRRLYSIFEADHPSVIENNEILLASPGVQDVLCSPRDFVSFQGFPVIVTTSELFKKKTSFEGTLQVRDEESVVISVKGRIVKIPVGIVSKVELPKAKFEPNDYEIKKLR
jgi:ribosome maturation factor RimP